MLWTRARASPGTPLSQLPASTRALPLGMRQTPIVVIVTLLASVALGCGGSVSGADAGEAADAMAEESPPAGDGGCGAPDAATYACMPQPLDAGGCPPWGDTDGGAASYPVGCVATVPRCSGFTVPPSPLTCNCTVDVPPFDGGAQWVCPL